MRRLRLAPFLLVALCACTKPNEEPAPIDPKPGKAEFPRCAPGVAPLPPRIERGVCVAHNYQAGGKNGYGSKTSDTTLRELKTLGVQWVSLTPFGFMERLDVPIVHPIGGYRAGETDERMVREIAQAKARGFHVLLKPHLWIVDGKWRGEIDFQEDRDWQRWFDSYETWMLGYADMAEAHDVENLVIGVELRTTESRLERRWRRLIRQIRKRYSGKLTYSANWDDAHEMPWWDAVDYIGVQFYPPLASRRGATPEQVGDVMKKRVDEIEALANEVGKPVIFTEVGFRNATDALVHPHAWPERAGKVSVDQATQALGYRALVDAISTRPWVAGLYWWKWFTDPDTTEEGPAGFSPRGRLAESIVRAAYGGNCDATTPTP